MYFYPYTWHSITLLSFYPMKQKQIGWAFCSPSKNQCWQLGHQLHPKQLNWTPAVLWQCYKPRFAMPREDSQHNNCISCTAFSPGSVQSISLFHKTWAATKAPSGPFSLCSVQSLQLKYRNATKEVSSLKNDVSFLFHCCCGWTPKQWAHCCVPAVN